MRKVDLVSISVRNNEEVLKQTDDLIRKGRAKHDLKKST